MTRPGVSDASCDSAIWLDPLGFGSARSDYGVKNLRSRWEYGRGRREICWLSLPSSSVFDDLSPVRFFSDPSSIFSKGRCEIGGETGGVVMVRYLVNLMVNKKRGKKEF